MPSSTANESSLVYKMLSDGSKAELRQESSSPSLKISINDTEFANGHGAVMYHIVTTITTSGMEYTTKRRYREFYAFALEIRKMLPDTDLWHFLPPRTCCCRPGKSPGFIERRKYGLENYLNGVIEIMFTPKRKFISKKLSLTEIYIVREFLDIPYPIEISDEFAFDELKSHALSTEKWKLLKSVSVSRNQIFEKVIDGYTAVKRVAKCQFSVHAVFNMIMAPFDGENSKKLKPWLIQGEIIKKISDHAWIEHVFEKTSWCLGIRELVNRVIWRVEGNGSIVIVTISGDLTDWIEPNIVCSKADCILSGWILQPTIGSTDSSTITWFSQTNFLGGINYGHNAENLPLLISRSALLTNISTVLRDTYRKRPSQSARRKKHSSRFSKKK